MLRTARHRAARLDNVVFLDRAVEDLDFPAESFHVVLSRWCLMFLTELNATLRELHRLLTPGGVLAAAVWGPPAETPVVGLPYQVLSRELQLFPAPAGEPGTHGLADPRICAEKLRNAGFTDVSVTAGTAPFWWESSADFARFTWDVMAPAGKQMLAEWCTPQDRSRIRRALIRAAAEHGTAEGRIRLPSRVLYLRAVKRAPSRRPLSCPHP
jgi:SAM-dependent methyltransferase